MKLTNITKGLSRDQYLQQCPEINDFNVLEDDWRKLFQWVNKISRNLYYYNSLDEKDGNIGELWENQLLVILIEIYLFDIQNHKKLYIENKGNIEQKYVFEKLEEFIEDKIQRLEIYKRDILLSGSGDNILMEISDELLIKLKTVHSIIENEDPGNYISMIRAAGNDLIFSKVLEIIEEIHDNYDYYMNMIEESGHVDPSLTVMVIFLRNYCKIVKDINNKFRNLSEFYTTEILKVRLREALPDHVWLILEKHKDALDFYVPRNTKFIAGKNEDGATLHYYVSDQDVKLTNLQLSEVYSLCLEKDKEKVPFLYDDKSEFVTSIYKKKIPLVSDVAQELFYNSEENTEFVPIGWVIESPMFDLREGEREVKFELELTKKSVNFIDNFIKNLRSTNERYDVENIFKDAFFIRLSTNEGWKDVNFCESKYIQGDYRPFIISFNITEKIQSTSICEEKIHGINTKYPAVQIKLNKNAHFFPYFWATEIEFTKIYVYVLVSGIRTVKVYNEYGKLDTSVPFYPFGIKAKRGAWLAFGNYEMSQKPLEYVTFSCKWRQLPDNDTGFKGHYALYKIDEDIDNYSFKIDREYLQNRRWINQSYPIELFSSDGRDTPVNESVEIDFEISRDMPVIDSPEEKYELGISSNGFLRMVLCEPEIGFGHELYRQLYAATMISNSKNEAQEPFPNEPISPLMNEIELAYSAHDDIYILHEKKTRFYQITPLKTIVIDDSETISLAQKIYNDANLMFSFSNALDMDIIRLFFDIAVRKEEAINYNINKDNLCTHWYYNDGREWIKLDVRSMLQDTTQTFTNTGVVEILLPTPIKDEWLDSDKKFWLMASIEGDYTKCQQINGFYLNAVEVIADGGNGNSLPSGTITETETKIPGLKSIKQLLPGFGGTPAEDKRNLLIRMANRISHRNRALIPVDFERMVLEKFSSIEKVKCITSTESDSDSIKLVVMGRGQNEKYPLCSFATLQKIKDHLIYNISTFANLEIINPVYEEIEITCEVKLKANIVAGETVKRLNREINEYIAPWMSRGIMPELDREISMKKLYDILLSDEGVQNFTEFSLQMISKNGAERKSFSLYILPDQFQPYNQEDITIANSYPWGVFIPASEHFIKY